MQNPVTEQECQQDAIERISTWLQLLEERVKMLLQPIVPGEMKPAERELAATRHLQLMARLLQARQKFAEPNPSAGEQALLDAILGNLEAE